MQSDGGQGSRLWGVEKICPAARAVTDYGHVRLLTMTEIEGCGLARSSLDLTINTI